MAFNIEYGGVGVDFDSVSKAIEKAGADVVGIEEGWGNVPDIAKDLGWKYYDNRTQVVSKYPLLNPPDKDSEAILVQPVPGQSVAILNVHLPSSGFGPNHALTGDTPAELVGREERQRMPALRPVIDEAKDWMADETPVFVMGDFNSPSHLDWTKQTVGMREQVRFAMPWPTSIAMKNAGMTDTYRVIYPDPVKNPGLTWPASRPFVEGYNPGPNGRPADRIDYIYASPDITTKSIAIVGESKSEYSDITVNPWPSDHRALIGTYSLSPGPTPTLVSVDQRLGEAGTEREVTYSDVDGNAASLALVPRGQAIGDAVKSEQVSDGSQGTWQMVTKAVEPGDYDIVLSDSDGEPIVSTPFWLIAPGTSPTLTASKQVRVGEPIKVTWNNAPGNRWDWLGAYKRGAPTDEYLTYQYTEATIQGASVIDGKAWGEWPLPAGKYSVYLLQDDSYKKLASADFTVKK